MCREELGPAECAVGLQIKCWCAKPWSVFLFLLVIPLSCFLFSFSFMVFLTKFQAHSWCLCLLCTHHRHTAGLCFWSLLLEAGHSQMYSGCCVYGGHSYPSWSVFNKYIYSTDCVPGTDLRNLTRCFTTIWWGMCYYYPNYTDEVIKASKKSNNLAKATHLISSRAGN